MSGAMVKGEAPTYYKRAPSKPSTDWPPRFMKVNTFLLIQICGFSQEAQFVLHVSSPSSTTVTEIAFLDARRLGRIRLVKSPLNEPPISSLGFDPILSMPSLDDFKQLVSKRSCPIKALLLDQSFSAGVGNWVADEILYHARIHPEQRTNTLTENQLAALHRQTSEVCRIAVEVNADDYKFPQDWLFRHRWGKGKKSKGVEPLQLPSGEPATIKWVTVGGRTSAYVVELQHLTKSKVLPDLSAKDDDDGSESDLTVLSDSSAREVVVKSVNKKRKLTTRKKRSEVSDGVDAHSAKRIRISRTRSQSKMKGKAD
ncbi:hypothetical protein EW146_g3547 [Bondarzewia mesenterica]|uniref:Formamidopyrimidine-DNA glycosylase H2TH DNA-binding domain-containing protein n=1 Tax=Bondarzewia mesenterica TaxID=1095465 RepID=A0A4V3XFE9_9AGAM|nr:hypothetical protein EW146_g3547 [Bondarzewia mesenterica]